MSDRLTAEQVQHAIERHFGKVAVLDDGGPVEWRDDWVCKVGIDYRGIADELNATLGSDRERAVERIERFCTDYAALLDRASGVHPGSDEFGRLEQEETRLILELADELGVM